MSPNELFDLSGRVAVVTGASRGIGESIARTLAGAGAHVVVSSRKIDGCEAVAASIRDAGGSAEALTCHIGDMGQIEAFWKTIAEQHGKVDVLVNNAAANPYFGPTVDTPVDAFEKTVDVNIRGYFYMTARAAKMMAAQGGGSVINVASVNGKNPGPLQGIYSITKAAVISMTQSFAKEMGDAKGRVNALLPGITDTKFASALVHNDDMQKLLMPHVPLRRVAQPEEMAGAVLYLASDASSYCTGAALNVDGGYLIG